MLAFRSLSPFFASALLALSMVTSSVAKPCYEYSGSVDMANTIYDVTSKPQWKNDYGKPGKSASFTHDSFSIMSNEDAKQPAGHFLAYTFQIKVGPLSGGGPPTYLYKSFTLFKGDHCASKRSDYGLNNEITAIYWDYVFRF